MACPVARSMHLYMSHETDVEAEKEKVLSLAAMHLGLMLCDGNASRQKTKTMQGRDGMYPACLHKKHGLAYSDILAYNYNASP